MVDTKPFGMGETRPKTDQFRTDTKGFGMEKTISPRAFSSPWVARPPRSARACLANHLDDDTGQQTKAANVPEGIFWGLVFGE
jgi:hypothetical protein